MMPLWVAFACGVVLGGIGGVLIMCLCFVAKRSDSYISTIPAVTPTTFPHIPRDGRR